MTTLKSYMDLDVWKKSCELTKLVYETTKLFPADEQFGLTSQMRRASVSVPSNIAEGCGRNGPKDSMRFFYIARGGLYEIETQTLLSNQLNFIDAVTQQQILERIIECKKLLNGFINYHQKLSEGKVTEPIEYYKEG
ncbi:MAG: four helix bundle protein [Cyclobacteriaceae bacterium]